MGSSSGGVTRLPKKIMASALRPAVAIGGTSLRKLWLIAVAVCAGHGVPFFATLYIPNTAQVPFSSHHPTITMEVLQASMQSFIYAEVFRSSEGTNVSSSSSERSGVSASLLWSLFIAEMALGQLVGYLVASPILDRFGRRAVLIGASLFLVSFRRRYLFPIPTATGHA